MSSIEGAFATEMGRSSVSSSREDFLEEVAFKVSLEGVLGFQR